MRLGTRKSRAPSGVERVSTGVSMSTKSRALRYSRIARTTVWRSSIVSRIPSRRRSITRWRSRSVSSTAPSSSTGNGGVADSASSSTLATSSSISPVARFGLTLPGSRRTTSPEAEITCSGRSRSAAAWASGRGLRMEGQLHEPGPVAQVDEDQPAVVAAAVDPARDAHGVADAGGVERAAPRVAVAVRARRPHSTAPHARSDAFVGFEPVAMLIAECGRCGASRCRSPPAAGLRSPCRAGTSRPRAGSQRSGRPRCRPA